jgi:hypothetical protein
MKNIIFLLLITFFCSALIADTTVNPGPVSGSWTAAGSPYLIMGNIVVNDGTTLNIDPGVEVIFQGTYKLDVLGRIVCTGLPEEMVTFTAADTLNGWSAIRFLNNAAGLNQPSEFFYTNFLYGRSIHGSGGADMMNYGGAIWADNAGTITISNCMFNRCKTSQDGSAIFAQNGTNIIMSDTTVKHCESGFFGGVYVKQGNAQITDCIFLNNHATTFGAALYFYECPAVDVTSCLVVGNTAGAVAGIYSFDSPVSIINCLFLNNATVTGMGGGMGVIYGTLQITNCTFAGNYSPLNGGAVWINQLDEPATVTNSIFWNNAPVAFTANSTSYNLAYCSMQTAEGDATNIFGNPLFTNAANGDVTLQPESPCIDAGTPNPDGLGLPLTDLAGLPRIVDGDGNGTVRIDMGCYEWQVPVTTGFIAGRVTDSQNQPLQGANIFIGAVILTTDADGYYSVELDAGVYNLTCVLPDYEPVTVNGVMVIPGETATVDFVLNPVSNADQIVTPAALSLSNHPNPFRQLTTITFSMDKAGDVSLEIYNLKGQKVRSLLNESLKAGSYSLDWNGTDANNLQVGSGIYLSRMIQGNKVLTRRIIKL